ncbi:MAG: thioredoxin family protein [Gammaproteobacteria bacterium]|nr:thioredoxin family protein [Gammaproteobacteria bacterium]
MVLTATPICDFGRAAPDFCLRGVDGRDWSLDECRGERGTLVMFICNHCPYVKAILARLVGDVRALEAHGVRAVAIMPNDPVDYPEDSFENMQRVAREQAFTFPYLYDRTQEVARAYGAVCTPDFFGYDAGLALQYRGRLDASRLEPAPPEAPRELYEAMCQVAATGHGPRQQTASMGCSIKWRRTI